MSEEVKKEGDFSLKGKSIKPKDLGAQSESMTKIDIPNTVAEAQGEVEPDLVKIEIKNTKEEDAIQEQGTESGVLEPMEQISESGEETKVGLQEVGEGDEESTVTIIEEQTEKLADDIAEAVNNQQESGIQLPENIQKVVDFMNETGGNLEDYVRLNANYDNIDNKVLLKEYYSKSKPHLDPEDIDLILEDLSYDETLDDEIDIRRKKIAFKEEVGKAKDYLEGLKSKYYEEIKLRPGVTQEQKKALDFFNRYNEDQQIVKKQHEGFVNRTKQLLSNDFKGFDFNVGEKKFRYNVKNPDKVAEAQSDITNFIKTFLNEKNEVEDIAGYHKALYAARNADTIAKHFYEQGKADAVKDVMLKSKNITTEPRATAPGDVMLGGFKVKAINGVDSSKLKIKNIK